MAETTTSPAEAVSYLNSLLNRNLRLHTSDGRIFSGQMKCTDNERNIILSNTQEHRQVSNAIKISAPDVGPATNARPAMTKRFVGLVVVPGKYIDKIEIEG